MWPRESFLGVLLKQTLQEILEDWIHLTRPFYIIPARTHTHAHTHTQVDVILHKTISPRLSPCRVLLDDHPDELDYTASVEGRESSVQLKEDAA